MVERKQSKCLKNWQKLQTSGSLHRVRARLASEQRVKSDVTKENAEERPALTRPSKFYAQWCQALWTHLGLLPKEKWHKLRFFAWQKIISLIWLNYSNKILTRILFDRSTSKVFSLESITDITGCLYNDIKGEKDQWLGMLTESSLKKNAEIGKSRTRNLRIQMGFSLSIRAQGN